ncbi:hypothetical protein CK203_036991 [Vitis vinifera]|uniref:Uncharacterized protein n=1 Tax=Vitis vinifera TaxID=29760 RepID=A0A438IVK0_VITVI|nr:hypothetical protein CK203_036991 [Vitis vinifera]
MAETTKLCILALGTFPGNLSSKELEGPFRKRKWCLRDFADTQEGLRNHFAEKGYSRRAAKLAFILRFSASNLSHISGNFRRKSTTLFKKVAKSLRNKRALRENDDGKGQPEMLSAIQLKKGLKQCYDTYVAALIKIKNGQSVEVPDSVVKILKEFKDVMLAELPKELMSPVELLELRKQLRELLDAGLIQPLRVPYGEPVLFQKKHDDSLCMCVDYRALNKAISKCGLRQEMRGRPLVHMLAMELVQMEGGIGDSKGHKGKALTTPRGHHGMALGVPRTHRQHSSTHTWAP